jgi:hypothetical protein
VPYILASEALCSLPVLYLEPSVVLGREEGPNEYVVVDMLETLGVFPDEGFDVFAGAVDLGFHGDLLWLMTHYITVLVGCKGVFEDLFVRCAIYLLWDHFE